MKDEQQRYLTIGAVIGVGLLLILALGRGQMPGRSEAFCQAVFKDLTQGKQSVQRWIDWERLKALDIDIGLLYRRLPNARERRDCRVVFVRTFAAGFAQSGGTWQAFANWRVLGRESGHVIVGADYLGKNKTLLLIVPEGKRRVVSIQWADGQA